MTFAAMAGCRSCWRALVGGGSMLLSSQAERTGDFLARAGRARVAFLSGTPTHWRRALLCQEAARICAGGCAPVRRGGGPADPGCATKGVSGGAHLPRVRVNGGRRGVQRGRWPCRLPGGLAGAEPERRGGVPQGGHAASALRGRAAARYLGADAPALREPDGFVDTKDVVEVHGGRAMFAGRAGRRDQRGRPEGASGGGGGRGERSSGRGHVPGAGARAAG